MGERELQLKDGTAIKKRDLLYCEDHSNKEVWRLFEVAMLGLDHPAVKDDPDFQICLFQVRYLAGSSDDFLVTADFEHLAVQQLDAVNTSVIDENLARLFVYTRNGRVNTKQWECFLRERKIDPMESEK